MGLVFVVDRIGIVAPVVPRRVDRGFVNETGMHRVVGVLVVQLPVAAVFQPEDTAVLENIAVRRPVDQVVQNASVMSPRKSSMVGPVVRQTGEDEAPVFGDPRRAEQGETRIGRMSKESGMLLRCGTERNAAVEGKSPRVIGADEAGGTGALDRTEGRAAMGAAVERRHGLFRPRIARHQHVVQTEAGADQVVRLRASGWNGRRRSRRSRKCAPSPDRILRGPYRRAGARGSVRPARQSRPLRWPAWHLAEGCCRRGAGHGASLNTPIRSAAIQFWRGEMADDVAAGAPGPRLQCRPLRHPIPASIPWITPPTERSRAARRAGWWPAAAGSPAI